MIVESLLNLIFLPVIALINLLPSVALENVAYIEFPQIARWGAYFFPLDVVLVAVGSFGTWYLILMAWAIIEWIYKKIPGIN